MTGGGLRGRGCGRRAGEGGVCAHGRRGGHDASFAGLRVGGREREKLRGGGGRSCKLL